MKINVQEVSDIKEGRQLPYESILSHHELLSEAQVHEVSNPDAILRVDPWNMYTKYEHLYKSYIYRQGYFLQTDRTDLKQHASNDLLCIKSTDTAHSMVKLLRTT